MFTGVHILEPQVLELIPSGRYCSISEELYPRLIEQGVPLYGYMAGGYWIDIGTPQRYLQVHRDVLAGKAPLQVELPENPPGIWLSEGISLGKGVELHPPVVLGPGCQLESGCIIGPWVVIGKRCHLSKGVRLQNSVLWEDVRIGKNNGVERCILGRGVILPAETELRGNMAAQLEGAIHMVEVE